MIEIMNNTYKLNQIVCLGYLNKRGYYEVVSGRICDYCDKTISLDTSYDFWQLDEILKINKNNIKYIKRTDNDMWR